MSMNKTEMLAALRRFVNQRSGIEPGNYDCGDWKRSRECFMGDYRPILKHGRHARMMLREVERCDSITAEALREASRAYSGRLQFVEKDGKVGIEYTTGQYFPTEYRSAACAVLALALWEYFKANLGESDGTRTMHGCEVKTYHGKTALEVIQAKARREFGQGIAATWFN